MWSSRNILIGITDSSLMDSTMLILEQRFATFILLRVYEKPGIMKTEALDEEGGSMNAKYQTLKKLINYGLIREDEKTYKHNVRPLFCTELGAEVCEHLKAIHDMLPKTECSSAEYK